MAGQYFKAFGFTVVLSVMMSLFVARMITPLIAAYFLRSHGVQPHANWRWMDVYLKVLNWSLDTSKANALLAKMPMPARNFGYYALGGLLLLPVLGAFGGGTFAAMKGLGLLGLPGAIGFAIAVVVGGALAYGAVRLIAVLVQLVFTAGLALALAALAAHFRDIRDILANVLTLWFFATPIIYPWFQPNVQKFRTLFNVNLFTHLAVSYQEILFFNGPIGHWRWLVALGAYSIVQFLAAYWLFDRLRDSFAEVV